MQDQAGSSDNTVGPAVGGGLEPVGIHHPSEVPPTGERAFKQLAAMRMLLDPARTADSHDILLATVFEALSTGPKSLHEVIDYVRRVWTGAVVLQDPLLRVLEEAAARGFVSEVKRLDSSSSWSLDDRGAIRLEESQQWALDVLKRCQRQVGSEATRNGLRADPDQVIVWTRILCEALDDGIAATFASRPADTRIVNSRIFPPYDRDALVAAVDRRCDDPTAREFLRRLALTALDPQSTFGSELVHYVATGYVLYAFMAREDMQAAQGVVGSLHGEVAILDTPVLLRLVGSADLRLSTLDVLTNARLAGLRLVILEKTEEEVTAMLMHRDREARRLGSEMADGVPRERLAATSSDAVLVAWLQAAGRPTWEEFQVRAQQVIGTLVAIGAESGASPNLHDMKDVALLELIRQQITAATADSGHERAAEPVAHDAKMVLLAMQVRDDNPASESKVWPGAVVVSPDSYLDPVYRRVRVNELSPSPLSVSVSQLAVMVAHCTTADGVEKLAEAISRETSYEARLARATRFAPAQALEFARAITGVTVDEVVMDAEELQLTFSDILSDGDDPQAVARAAVVAFESRRSSAQRAQLDEQREEGVRERERAAIAQAQLDASGRQRDLDSRTIEALVAAGNKSDSKVTTQRRYTWIMFFYAAALLILVVIWFTLSPGLVAMAIPALVMIAGLNKLLTWARTPDESPWVILIASASWLAILAITLMAESVFLAPPKR